MDRKKSEKKFSNFDVEDCRAAEEFLKEHSHISEEYIASLDGFTIVWLANKYYEAKVH